ncbi:unnamed protein product, partial [Didymodactylos carnosus]
IKGIIVHREELIGKVSIDQVKRAITEDTTPMSIYNHADQTYTNLQSDNSRFMWFQLYIEILLHIQHTITIKDELVNICKETYKDNRTELNIIIEFEHQYVPSDAIKWYTRECCLYKLLNNGLSVRNIDMLFAFCFLIKDIYKQLETIYENTISTDELNRIKSTIGQFISMNSFLSTSRNQEEALFFTRSITISETIQRILFEIDADTSFIAKPFDDIVNLSYIRQEEEVLFMLDSIFRIKNIIYDENKSIWIISLVLCSDNDQDLKDIFAYMKQEMGEETSLVSLENLPRKMGEFEKAENYFNRLLKELLMDDQNISSYYTSLDLVAKEKCLANNFNNIDAVYEVKRQYEPALKNYHKAFKIYRNSLGPDDLQLAKCYNNIGNIAQKKEIHQYDMPIAYFTKALEIAKKNLPDEHFDLATHYHNIGLAYYDTKKVFAS